MLICTSSIYAQKDKPKEVDITYAKSLKEKYDDEDVIIIAKKIELFFSRNARTQKVEVLEKKRYEFIGISQRAELGYSTGYDNQSSISNIKLLDNRGKEVFWSVYDKAYSEESIFHNDYRIKYGSFSLPLQGYKRTLVEEKEYLDIKYFIAQYFSDPYRIKRGELIIHIPDWLTLELKEFNFENIFADNSETRLGLYNIKSLQQSLKLNEVDACYEQLLEHISRDSYDGSTFKKQLMILKYLRFNINY